MTDEKRRPRPAAQYGDTAKTVAQNVKRLREIRNLTIYALSSALGDVGRPITPSAVAKIERLQRQVTVDDLAALSVVFKVAPSALLLPLKDAPTDTVDVTGAGTVSAEDAWDWADGFRPLKVTPGEESTELLEFDLYSRPSRRRRERQLDPRQLAASAHMRELIMELSKEGRSGAVVNPALMLEDDQPREGS
ncbi:helix-turn-helix domain-containing protein [Actinacidiphila glaucinigra]|uniref:helix-turn-helix domain-containing protein n=1 Tax=Actinacidiphila glaucinigra TaxID=235986 RepID=UPI00371B0F96